MIELPDTATLVQACENLPVFPLPGVVLFPHTVIRLHVFETRYVQLLEDCLAGNRLFALPQLSPSLAVDEVVWLEAPPFHSVAGIGYVLQSVPMPQERYNIAVLGVGTVAFATELERDRGYRRMQGRLMEPAALSVQQQEQFNRTRLLFAQLLGRKELDSETLSALLDEGREPAQVINILLNMLVEEPHYRQQLLGQADLSAVLDLVEQRLMIVLSESLGGSENLA